MERLHRNKLPVGLQNYRILFHLGLNGMGKQECDQDAIFPFKHRDKTRDIYIRESIPSSENEKEPCH